MEKIVLTVEGMSCAHCENAVKKAVSALDGVASVAVDLPAKTVSIEHDGTVSTDAIKEAIEDQGYDVVQPHQ
jgi:copper ion binding protein